MENNLAAAQATQILQLSPQGVLVLDEHQHVTWANAAFEAFVDRPFQALVTMQWGDLLGKVLHQDVNNEDIYYCDVKDGRRWFAGQRKKLTDGGLDALFLTEITAWKAVEAERDRLSAEFHDLASVDPNSGLLTYQAIVQNLKLLVTRSRRYGNPLSIMVMDVNDIVAREDADQVLIAIGQFLKDQMRWADLIARTDDKRFLFVLPETPQEATEALIEKIAARLEAFPVPYPDGKAVAVNARFGVAAWQKGDDDNLLLARAQEALA